MTEKRTAVKVRIVGEEYTIRSEATAEHTKAVAAHVDQAIRRVMDSGHVVETHKAAILAALQITDELYQARAASEGTAEAMDELATELSRLLPPGKRPA